MTLDIYRDFDELEDGREHMHGDHLADGPILMRPDPAAWGRYVAARKRYDDLVAAHAAERAGAAAPPRSTR